MMTHKRFHTIIAMLTLLVAGLSVTNWYFKPENASTWAIGLAAMPVIWAIVTIIIRLRPLTSYSEAERRFFTASVFVAGLMLAGAQGLKLTDTLGDFDMNFLDRVWGVAIGAVLVIMGNIMPKILGPLSAKRCSPSATQSIQRFSGWSFVLAGLAWIMAWAVLPVTQANTVAMVSVASSVVLVMLRCTWALATSRRT